MFLQTCPAAGAPRHLASLDPPPRKLSLNLVFQLLSCILMACSMIWA